ncbi:KpsF/GutQ family sugar-phosphate isomerase [Hydrogenimonas thermophila]|uniref:KpsF/GutQ family sugar-phosphate isomerase n=1 Tax=Hydrogenimonas thermophila TaxID=223786 RepID=UPI0029373147|nr:KpsF/GutQ family sugar-phosphate isomerase [Hydrogenimonas thermophila]WOE69954.1 KpsF/GutQ family sugar-phosphate isomerase [Hydrogenimonas thermophila]WOE72471.1 KpsF/GutQ family sugar-phosphate isomerase [Hydrogenimonas thermophila]
MNPQDIAKEVLETEAKTLLDAVKLIDDAFDKAVEIMYNTKGKCIITGVGKSGLIGAKIAATLASTGTPSFFIHPTEALHGDLGMIGPQDSVLAISYSGESEELIKILPHIKRFDIPLIAMAGKDDSILAKYGDVFLSIQVEKEACPLGAAPTSSTTLTLALGDALAVALMKKRNFKAEDFASFHPGGSLGKRLFVKIEDLMRKENLPKIKPDTPLKEAVVVMSEGRLGNVLIVDENDTLIGVLSDGDVRRALMQTDFSIDTEAIKYSNLSPKTCQNERMLASEALEMIENYKIQMLPIVDELGHVKGVLHLHDLVEAGIKR